jgi:hypothetical protein
MIFAEKNADTNSHAISDGTTHGKTFAKREREKPKTG